MYYNYAYECTFKCVYILFISVRICISFYKCLIQRERMGVRERGVYIYNGGDAGDGTSAIFTQICQYI